MTYYLATLQMDAETLAAALLHDVPEDTDFTLGDIEKSFGREVTQLVDGVTKLSKFGSARTMEEQQAENIRKMFMAMAEDVRVVIIKLADRLHNMRTLEHLPPEKQERIARQTMEIYAPLAHRLGMWQIKWELEDLSFKYLEPEKYRQLVEMLADRRRAREGFVTKSIGILRKELEKVDIKAEISGRPKHLYSIAKKMERKGAEFTEIYDLNAIRVLVDDVKDCYAALGIVHSLWRPVPGQFDDYIAMPKANMYQSLHTAVIGPEAKPLEVQIRTYQMHEVAEAGIAAHWRYKEGSRGDRKYDEKLAWVRHLMDWQREVTDPTEFVEGLKLDVFQDQVFVFTPKGDVKDLPRDATPLDFAYRIHTDVGHRTIGAKVNNRLVPLDYRLRNGDIVEIVTTKAAHGPSRDWLNIVRTSHAREKIRAWFKRQQRDENIAQGKDLLDRELRRLAHETLAGIDGAKLTEIAQQYKIRELDDFYAAIGYGAISSASVVSKLEIHDDVGDHAAGGGAAGGAVDDRREGQGRRRPARALREVLLTDPRRRDHRLRHARQGRDGAPRVVSIGAVRARHRAADRRRVGARRAADLPDHRPHQRAGPAGAAERDHERGRRVQGEHRGRLGRDPARRDRHDHRDLQGHLAPAAGQGPHQDRAPARRHLGHPRGQLTDEGRSRRGRRRHRPGRHPDLRDRRHPRRPADRGDDRSRHRRGLARSPAPARRSAPVASCRAGWSPSSSTRPTRNQRAAGRGLDPPPHGQQRQRVIAGRAGPIDSEPMAKKIAAPRGTRDLLPPETRAWEHVEAVARDLSRRYAFERIEIPLFERVELFARGLGESSDAVEKEMFRVGGASGSDEERAEWALRPEPTAGIVRAFIEHGMHVRPGPLRLYLIGPMFRYDRPQAGPLPAVQPVGRRGHRRSGTGRRRRADRAGASRFYAEVGLTDVVAHVNSIGDATCRPGYRQALVEYFSAQPRPPDR